MRYRSVPNTNFNIIDDDTPRTAALDWAKQQFIAGVDGDVIATDLSAQGWSADDVEQIVEDARQQTSDERGVVTYHQKIQHANHMYRRGSSGWMAGIPSLGAVRRLLHAIASLRALGKK